MSKGAIYIMWLLVTVFAVYKTYNWAQGAATFPMEFWGGSVGLLALLGSAAAFDNIKSTRQLKKNEAKAAALKRKILELAEPYKAKLASRYRTLVHKDYYGNYIFDDWNRELDKFAKLNVYWKLDNPERQIYDEFDGTHLLNLHIISHWADADEALSGDDIDPHTLRNPDDFEMWCAQQCHQAGWDAHTTQSSSDFGADVIATNQGGETVAIQCKLYKGNVPISAVQEAAAAKAHYSTDIAIVVSTGGFSPAARKLARSTDVELLQATDLKAYMRSLLG